MVQKIRLVFSELCHETSSRCVYSKRCHASDIPPMSTDSACVSRDISGSKTNDTYINSALYGANWTVSAVHIS